MGKIKLDEKTGAYRVRVFVSNDEKGRPKQIMKSFRTKKEAEAWQREMEHNRDKGSMVLPSKQTVSDYLSMWLETYAKPSIAPNTYHDYYGTLKREVLSHPIAGLKMSALDIPDCQKLINEIAATPSKRGGEGKTRAATMTAAILHKAFREAVILRLIPRNPMDFVNKPKKRTAKRRVLNDAEGMRFLKTAEGSKYYALFRFLLETGCRTEEAYGLQWQDVDLDKHVVDIRQALVRDKAEPRLWTLSDVKTVSGRRRVDIDEDLSRVLRAHRKQQAAFKLAAHEYTDNGLVFAEDNGSPVWYSTLKDHFKKILKAAELDTALRVYDLRHSHISIAGEREVPLTVTSERVGHSSVVITGDVYNHNPANALRKAAKNMSFSEEAH